MKVGLCIPVGMRPQKAEVGPNVGPTSRLSHPGTLRSWFLVGGLTLVLRRVDDQASKTILEYMASENNACPSDWQKCRSLTSK